MRSARPAVERGAVGVQPEHDLPGLPRLQRTRAKPASQCTGRATWATGWLRYSWTISWPALVPVLRTVQVIFALPSVPMVAAAAPSGAPAGGSGQMTRPEYSKLV